MNNSLLKDRYGRWLIAYSLMVLVFLAYLMKNDDLEKANTYRLLLMGASVVVYTLALVRLYQLGDRKPFWQMLITAFIFAGLCGAMWLVR
jgi:hypothetical protein